MSADNPIGAEGAHKFLIKNEALVELVRFHPVVLVRPALAALAVAGVLIGAALQIPPAEDGFALLMSAAAVALAAFGWRYYEWYVERLIVTDRRIMLMGGVITRRINMMPMKKVTDMTFERPWQGRLLGRYGWGTFILESAGQDQALSRIEHLPHPEQLYLCVSEQVFGDGRGSSDPDEDGAPRRPVPAPDRAHDRAEPAQVTAGPMSAPVLHAGEPHDDTGPLPRVWWVHPRGEEPVSEPDAGPAARGPRPRGEGDAGDDGGSNDLANDETGTDDAGTDDAGTDDTDPGRGSHG